MNRLRQAAQAVVKAYLAEPDKDGGYSVLTMREIDALRDALAEPEHDVAAPELLEALKAVLNQSWDGPLPDFIREKACDAISKAEGLK